MILLFLIGIIHAFLIWFGDILAMYAVLGLLVLPFYRATPKTLVLVATIVLLWPTVQTILVRSEVLSISLGAATNYSTDEAIALNTASGIAGHLAFNLSQILPVLEYYLSSTLYYSFGMILLGVAVGKYRFFQDIEMYIKSFRKVFFLTTVVVAVWNVYMGFFFDPSLMRSSFHFYVYWSLFNLSLIAQTFFVVSGVALLLRSNSVLSRFFGYFRFLGRMSLSNYIMHSLFGILIYKIMGFYGSSIPFIDLVLTIGITLVQIKLSQWWLVRYSSGPIEKLWRKSVRIILGNGK